MDMFSAPIPGESLTKERGNAAWEQPPQYTRVEEVFKFYLDKFEDEKVFEDMLYLFDKGMPIDLFVDSMMLSAEQKGIHLFDLGFLVGPLLHEYLVGICIAGDIDYIEFQDEMPEARVDRSIEDFMNEFGGDSGVLGDVSDNLEEAQDMNAEGQSFAEGQGEASPAPEVGGEPEPVDAPVGAPTEAPSGNGLMRRPQ